MTVGESLDLEFQMAYIGLDYLLQLEYRKILCAHLGHKRRHDARHGQLIGLEVGESEIHIQVHDAVGGHRVEHHGHALAGARLGGHA